MLLVVVWYALSFYSDPFFFPYPHTVTLKILELLGGDTLYDLVFTFLRIMLLLLFVLCISALAVITALKSDALKNFIRELAALFVKIPTIAYITIFMILCGVNDFSIYLSILAVSVPFTILNLIAVFDKRDQNILDMAQVFNVRFLLLVRFYYENFLKESLQSLFVATFSLSYKALIMAEFLIGVNGLGRALVEYRNDLDMSGVLASVVLIALLGTLIQKGLEAGVGYLGTSR